MSDVAYSVLLVDDDRFLLDMYSVKFAKEGFTVQSSLSVDEAIEILKNGYAADAVVFDLVMPKKDGRELLRSIHEQKLAPKAALIALTNQSGDEDRRETEALGVDRYIIKASMIPSEVVNTVREVIRAHSKA